MENKSNFNRPIKNIIFDWSGTLFDDFKVSHHCTNVTLKNFGGPSITAKEYRENFELPVWKFYRLYLNKASINELHEFYFNYFENHMYKAKLFPGVRSLLKRAQGMGIRLFIFSTVHAPLLESLCQREKIHSLFQGIYGGIRDKERALPRLCHKLGLKKNETLFVGDMEHDVSAAKRSHIKSGIFLCGYRPSHFLFDAAPDFIWQDARGMTKFLFPSYPNPLPNRPFGDVLAE